MSERLRAIVDDLDIQASDRVLEIGCGHGLAAGMVCERLRSGCLVAIDKSKKMIDAAVRRNHAHVASGRAQFHVTDVVDYKPGRRKFNKIFAVRVGLFHRDPSLARSLLEPWLAPGGKIVLVYDEP
ncbi:class I SAM-dependent methyltransferase [Steroidobacter sp. S1-65]|uniref:Class I SAM-dependent methyltransferase n=1 Tax=Steroidobacter gossypii TaxID=2805490 RepID=A0ABS1WTS0_9GAMM|nr:class I SAM-dependent methyltransferase [Steroidobacter gossypii]MBM0104373.1 class I SAM-dependent methyltransferase [Steroidobacter gossypii]